MKLQKQISAKKGDQEFYKYVIILPSKTVEELGWSGGQELVCNVTSKSLLLVGPSSKSNKWFSNHN